MNDLSPQSGTSSRTLSKRPMPREIGSGVWWLGDCLGQPYNGKIYHGYNAAHMVVGTKAALLSDTGHPKDFPGIAKHIEHVLARNPDVPLKYLFLTHQETPHSGGLGRLLARFPELEVVGDVSGHKQPVAGVEPCDPLAASAQLLRPFLQGTIDFGDRSSELVGSGGEQFLDAGKRHSGFRESFDLHQVDCVLGGVAPVA